MQQSPARGGPGSELSQTLVPGEHSDSTTPSETVEVTQCSICFEAGGNMIKACKCAAMVHPACLERWLNTRTQTGHACEVCKGSYNVSMKNKVQPNKTCSGDAWAQYCTCLVVSFSFSMTAMMVVVYLHTEEHLSGQNEGSEWLLWVLSLVAALMFLSTVKKIHERWREAVTSERIVFGTHIETPGARAADAGTGASSDELNALSPADVAEV